MNDVSQFPAYRHRRADHMRRAGKLDKFLVCKGEAMASSPNSSDYQIPTIISLHEHTLQDDIA